MPVKQASAKARGGGAARAVPFLVLFVILVLTVIAVVLWRRGFQFESLLNDKRLNTVLGVATTVVGAVAKMLQGSRRQAPVADENLQAAVEEIAARNTERYRREAGNRGLLYNAGMGVRWQVRQSRDGGRAALSPPGRRDVTELHGFFAGLEGKRLVIEGPAGAGKTSAGLLTALALLDGRRDPAPGAAAVNPAVNPVVHPVPMLVGLQDWRPGRQSLKEWLISELDTEFDFLRNGVYGRETTARLVEGGYIIPFIDDAFAHTDVPPDPRARRGGPGPDGAPAEGRRPRGRRGADSRDERDAQLIDFLNHRNAEPGDPELGFVVMTDRTAYHDAIRWHQPINAVHVELDLPAEAAIAYLKKTFAGDGEKDEKPRWRENLVERLQSPPAGAAGVLESPLCVSLIERLLYSRKGRLKDLPVDDVPAAEKYIYTQFIESAAERHGGRYRAGEFEACLRFLARRMSRTGTLVLELPRINVLIVDDDETPWWRRRLTLAALRLLAPMVVGSASGALVCALAELVGAVIHYTFVLSTGWGGALGACVGLSVGLISERRGRRDKSVWRVDFALGNALAAAAVTLSVLLAAESNTRHLRYTLYTTVITFLMVGLLSSPAPPWSLRVDSWSAPLNQVFAHVNIFVAVAVGLAVGGGFSADDGWSYGLAAGAAMGFGFGFMDRMSYRLQDAQNPRQALRNGRRQALSTGVVFALALALPLGGIDGKHGAADPGSDHGLAVGLTVGLGVFLLSALAVWWAGDDTVRTRMVCRQLQAQAPGLSIAMLDDACREQILRSTGKGYGFSNVSLQRYLEAQAQPAPPLGGQAPSTRPEPPAR
jgi:hypothetical protein